MDENVIQIQQPMYMGNDVNVIVPVFKSLERVVIEYDSNKNENRSISPLIIQLAGPVPYSSDKFMPYKYNDAMVDNGKEVPLRAANLVVSIADVVKVSYSGCVFGPVFPKVVKMFQWVRKQKFLQLIRLIVQLVSLVNPAC